MKAPTVGAFGAVLALGVGFWAGTAVSQGASPAPVRLDRDKMARLELTVLPAHAYQDIRVAGELNMRIASLFEGRELRVSIFESKPAKTDHRARPTGASTCSRTS